ncbi:MAG: hypothetical protein WC268_02580 [Patescibacteria group bacterium]|jgi:hypothetical protein
MKITLKIFMLVLLALSAAPSWATDTFAPKSVGSGSDAMIGGLFVTTFLLALVAPWAIDLLIKLSRCCLACLARGIKHSLIAASLICAVGLWLFATTTAWAMHDPSSIFDQHIDSSATIGERIVCGVIGISMIILFTGWIVRSAIRNSRNNNSPLKLLLAGFLLLLAKPGWALRDSIVTDFDDGIAFLVLAIIAIIFVVFVISYIGQMIIRPKKSTLKAFLLIGFLLLAATPSWALIAIDGVQQNVTDFPDERIIYLVLGVLAMTFVLFIVCYIGRSLTERVTKKPTF